LFKLLFISGTLNAIVCYLQFIGDPYGLSIGLYFVDVTDTTIIDQFELLSSGLASGAYLYGLFGNAVYNGYFSMIIPFVPLYFYFKDSSNKNILPYFIFSILFLFVLFIIQERSCFVISIFLLLLLIYKSKILTGWKLTVCVFVLIFTILFSGFDYIMNNDIVQNSRLLSESEHSDVRNSIYSESISYISNNFALGGIESFRASARYSPHNIFLNAFIYGGFIGGMVLITLYVKQLYFSYRQSKFKERLAITAMFVSLMLNSLLHNNSILTGDLLVWILWGAVLAESKIGNSTIIK